LIRAGKYVKKSQGLEFEVGKSTLKHWADTFAAMLANGVDVTVPIGHTTDAEANRGYVRDMYADGDSLYGIIELVGEDAIDMAGRVNVSINSPPEFTDGKGNTYYRPITHVALTTNPVVPGLKGFEAIAASNGPSREGLDSIVLIFQQDQPMPDDSTTNAAPVASDAMDPKAALKKAFRAQILKAIDDETLDYKATLKAVAELLKKQEQVMGKLGDLGTNPPATDPAADPNATPAVPVSASLASVDTGMSKMVLSLAAENRKMKLDKVVAAGKLSPAARAKLEAVFIGQDNAALSLELSNGDGSRFDAVLSALMENSPVSLGERSRGQTVAMENTLSGSGENPLVKDAERRAKAAQAK
jgi:hypothetical protein